MADVGGRGLGTIAASMLSKASEKSAPTGIAGGVIEGITGNIKDFNNALKENETIRTKQMETEQELYKVQEKRQKLEKELRDHLIEDPKLRAKAKEQVEKLTAAEEKLNKTKGKLNTTLHASNEKMEKMNTRQGLLKNSAVLLTGKMIGLVGSFVSFRKALQLADERVKLAGKTLSRTTDLNTGYFESIKRVKDEAVLWNSVIAETNYAMFKTGHSVEETTKIMGTLVDNLRVTTESERDLAKMTGQITQDIGFMSKLLRVNTDELATATVTASKKFNKSTAEMSDELAGMYYELKRIKDTSPDVIFDIGDMTRAVFELQASTQGTNLNLRSTASIMGRISAAAMTQGASYEMAMKGAKGITDILAGNAPEWAKYMAGKDLVKEIETTLEQGKDTAKEYGLRMQKEFGFDPSTEAGKARKKALKGLAEEYRKTGSLSSLMMTNQLMKGTDKGMEAMFKQIKKHGSGKEGQQMLMRVWGLDEAAATAAVMAIRMGKDWRDFAGEMEEIEAAAADKKPPTVKDLRDAHGPTVSAIASAERGVKDTILGFFDSTIMSSPLGMAIAGIASTGASTALQLIQTGAIGKAGLGAMGAAGKAGGLAGKAGGAGMVVGAGVGGFAFGNKLREWSDALAEATGVTYLSIDAQAQLGMDAFATGLNKATFGLIQLGDSTTEVQRAQDNFKKLIDDGVVTQKQLNTMLDFERTGSEKDTEAFKKTAWFLKQHSAEQLKGLAKTTGISIDAIKDMAAKGMSDPEFQAFSAELRKEKEGPVAEGAPGEATTPGVTSSTGKGGKGKKKPPPVVTVDRLSPAQKKAVSQSIATKLKPEIGALSKTMFERMAEQSTEYWEGITSVTNVFWMDSMPKMAEETWDTVAASFEKKLKNVMGPTLMPLTNEDAEDGGGGEEGQQGVVGAGVGPDGSIHIRFSIPRDMIDASNRTARVANR